MAYALVTWDPPAGANPATVKQDVKDALTLYAGAQPPIELMERLFVYPSKPSGVGLSTVKGWLAPLAVKYPGIEMLIIMPSAGEAVSGWLDPAKDVARARPIMNQSCTLNPDGTTSGTCTYPQRFA